MGYDATFNTNKSNDRAVSSKSQLSAKSFKSNASQKSFEEWMKEKKEKKKQHKFRIQVEQEHRGQRLRGQTNSSGKRSNELEQERYSQPFKTHGGSQETRLSKEHYEPTEEVPVHARQ